MKSGVIGTYLSDPEPQNRYDYFGFIRSDSGPDVYFRPNRRRCYFCDGGNKLRWQWELSLVQSDGRIPKVGDVVVYADEPAPHKPGAIRATWWAFADEIEAAEKAITSRPRYRMLEQIHMLEHIQVDDLVRPKVVWQGVNLDRMRRGSYSLLERPTGEHKTTWKGKIVTVHRWFEVLRGDIWEQCEDPRLKLS